MPRPPGPYYEIKVVEAPHQAKMYRLLVWEEFWNPRVVFGLGRAVLPPLLDVVEAWELETLQEYLRDVHPTAMSEETISALPPWW